MEQILLNPEPLLYRETVELKCICSWSDKGFWFHLHISANENRNIQVFILKTSVLQTKSYIVAAAETRPDFAPFPSNCPNLSPSFR